MSITVYSKIIKINLCSTEKEGNRILAETSHISHELNNESGNREKRALLSQDTNQMSQELIFRKWQMTGSKFKAEKNMRNSIHGEGKSIKFQE